MTKILKQFLGLSLLITLVSSCIPNEKVLYLQNKELDSRLENDSLISLTRIDYRLQPNDILLINFYSRQEDAVKEFYPLFARPDNILNQGNRGGTNGQGGVNDPYLTGYNVDKEGNIEINALGRVKAAGLTTSELKYEIERQIKEKDGINDILVSVKLSGIPYTIYGEINDVGSNLLRQYEVNLLEAIAAAGDLTINADRNHVKILRQYPDGIRIHDVDVTGRSFIETEFFFIQPDDIIYVPPLKIREVGSGDTFLDTFAKIITVISGTALIISIVTN